MGTRKRKRAIAVGTQHTSALYDDGGSSSNSKEQSPSNRHNELIESTASVDVAAKRQLPQSFWSLQCGPFSGCPAQHNESQPNVDPSTTAVAAVEQHKIHSPSDMREPMLSTYITFERVNDFIKGHQHHSSLMDEDSVVHVKVLGSLSIRCSADDMRSPFEDSEMGRNLSSLSTHS